MSLTSLYPAAELDLAERATAPPKSTDKSKIKEVVESLLEELTGLQELLYANRKHSLLIILQGLDTSGKDGAIRQVFRSVSPLGLDIHAFKMPSAEEQAQDFLWRTHKRTPARGLIGIFNRSYYEAVVSDYVQKLCNKGTRERRLHSIRDFEKHLLANGTLVCKFYLHISKAEQKTRLIERLEDPSKQWKMAAADLEIRKQFDAYLAAYAEAIVATHREDAPWHIVPADNKWYRDYCVLKTIVTRLQALQMKYPPLAVPISPEDIPD